MNRSGKPSPIDLANFAWSHISLAIMLFVDWLRIGLATGGKK
jgi:hypothetical protein